MRSRREFLKTAGFGLAVAALAACAPQSATPTSEPTVQDPATATEKPKITPSQTAAPTKTVEPTMAPSASPSATLTPKENVLEWGLFTGDFETKIGDMEEAEERVGKKTDYLTTFVALVDRRPLPKVLKYAEDKNKKLIVYLEAYTPGVQPKDDVAFRNERILAGEHDEKFVEFADSIKDHKGEIIFSPYHEANGDWVPQFGGYEGNKGNFKDVMAYTQKFVAEMPHVRTALVMNQGPSEDIESYLPAPGVVQLAGVDVFNFPGDGPMTFEELGGRAFEAINEWKKETKQDIPVIAASVGCYPREYRYAWFEGAIDYAKKNEITGINIFAEDKRPQEADWRLDDKSIEVLKRNLD